MEQITLQLLEFLKSNYCIYATIAISVILLGFFISLSNNQRNAFKLILNRLPIISFILVILFILSLYNLFAVIILSSSIILLFLIPSNSNSNSNSITENFKAAPSTTDDEDDEDDNDKEDDKDNDDIDKYKTSKQEIENTVSGKENHQYNNRAGNNKAHSKSRNPDLGDELLNTNTTSNATTLEIPSPIKSNKSEPVKNYLSKSLNLYDNKYADKFNEALIENKNAIQKRMKTVMKNNSIHRENYSDVDMNGDENSSNNKTNVINSKKIKPKMKPHSDLTIMKRKFNINEETDKNLLNTREICTDIINRINYEYEDGDYLRKYIGSRVEEIIEINKLLDED